MKEYNRLVERQRKWMLYLLVFFLLIIAITPYKQIFMSIMLGYVAGYYSLRFLSSRVKHFSESIARQGQARSLGMFIRIAGVALIVILAARYPEKIHIPALAGGLGLTYIILFIDYTMQNLQLGRTNDKKSKNE